MKECKLSSIESDRTAGKDYEAGATWQRQEWEELTEFYLLRRAVSKLEQKGVIKYEVCEVSDIMIRNMVRLLRRIYLQSLD